MSRPTKCLIDLSALRHNIAVARQRAEGSQIYGVVKANAYGHGLLRTLPAWQELDGLALVELEQAALLREEGWQKPILLLEGIFAVEELDWVAQHDLAIVLHSSQQLAWLRAHSGRLSPSLQRPWLRVFVKVNTGMHRLGFPPESVDEVLTTLQQFSWVREIVLMTHFACADVAGGMAAPINVFEEVLRHSGVLDRALECTQWRGRVSLCNSAAFLQQDSNMGGISSNPRSEQIDRLGVMLYGASPFTDRMIQDDGFKPVMSLESALISIQEVLPGQSIGYGATYTVPATTTVAQRIGIVACGYADGYPRQAPTGTPIVVGGRLTRTLGRVSMDMLAVDLTGLPEAMVGTPVELWGNQLSIDRVARAAGTIGYELMCAIHPRVAIGYS